MDDITRGEELQEKLKNKKVNGWKTIKEGEEAKSIKVIRPLGNVMKILARPLQRKKRYSGRLPSDMIYSSSDTKNSSVSYTGSNVKWLL